MRDYREEFDKRVAYIRSKLAEAHADGIVFGSALVGILCKAACDNTVGVIMPCSSKRNYGEDAADGRALAEQFGIETRVVDLTPVREAELKALEGVAALNDMALTNIAPRLRMTTLYAIGAAENRLVAGTGNRSARAIWATLPSGATAPATSTPSLISAPLRFSPFSVFSTPPPPSWRRPPPPGFLRVRRTRRKWA